MSELRERAAEHAGGGQELSIRERREVEQRQRQQSLGGMLARLQPEMEKALPAHLSGERMARTALTVVRKNPALLACTDLSVAGSLLTVAALGLELDPPGEAYLIPYEHRRGPLAGSVECQLVVGYQGLAKLFWQSPAAQGLASAAVYEGDDFDYALGTAPFLRHKPNPNRAADAEVRYYYATARLANGGTPFVVLTPDEVKALRSGRVGPSGQIADPQRWMERKTALRQLAKLLPRSPQLLRAIDVDERLGSELYREREAEAQASVQVIPPPAIEQNRGQGAPPAAPPADQRPGGPTPSGRGSEAGERRTGPPPEEPPEDPYAEPERSSSPPAGEVVDRRAADQEPPPAEGDQWATRMISSPQLAKLHAGFGELNIDDRTYKLAYASDVVGREITSTRDLTLDEAKQVIDAQEQEIARAREELAGGEGSA